MKNTIIGMLVAKMICGTMAIAETPFQMVIIYLSLAVSITGLIHELDILFTEAVEELLRWRREKT